MNYKMDKNANILIIGDIMLDHYIYGNCNRISPEAPVQVVEVNRDVYTLGGAGNVLQNLLAFNCYTNIISVVGDDDDAQLVIDQLKEEGITNQILIRDQRRCTTVKSRVMVSNHQLIRLDREVTHPISDDTVAAIVKEFKERIHTHNIILLSDYNKGLLSVPLLEEIFSVCRAAGIKTIVDPKGNDFSKYKGVNIIKPNKKEAITASGINITNNETLRAACERIKQVTECDSVIITMSEDGIAFFSEGVLEIIPTKALDVVDVTGAGDTVLASLGLAFASGYTLWEACNFANHAAAVVVSKVGSATATLDEVEQKFKLII